MFATRSDSRSITPAVYARALSALGPSLAVTQDARVTTVRGRSLFPRVAVQLGALRFVIAHIRSRTGGLYFFADGRMVLLPSCSRDQAREIVGMFVAILDAYTAQN